MSWSPPAGQTMTPWEFIKILLWVAGGSGAIIGAFALAIPWFKVIERAYDKYWAWVMRRCK